MQKTLWIYGYDLGNGKFNEVGAAWTYEAAKNAVQELSDNELVIRSKRMIAVDRNGQKWKEA